MIGSDCLLFCIFSKFVRSPFSVFCDIFFTSKSVSESASKKGNTLVVLVFDVKELSVSSSSEFSKEKLLSSSLSSTSSSDSEEDSEEDSDDDKSSYGRCTEKQCRKM